MFIPKRIIFEKGALDYEIGQNVYNYFKDNDRVEKIILNSNKVKQNIPNSDDLPRFYKEGKRTLVVGVKKGLKFQSCKPSAHYQLPLYSGCMGQCQYCYLNTNLGDKPYAKINSNIDDILNQAQKYIDERLPDITIFEGSATSDPLPMEPYSGSLKKAIEFFAVTPNSRFRFVSKFSDVDTLLNINHNGKTEVRFTLNTNRVIKDYENATASIKLRLDACRKMAYAGYPIGIIIAPVFLYENYKEDYSKLLNDLRENISEDIKIPPTFEVISHRYTTRAKNIINEVFPENTLPMNDEERKYKYGQFGYGKFVYTKEELDDMKKFFMNEISTIFPKSEIKYII